MIEDADDLVPPKWRSLFNNQDWLIHDIVVKSIYGFMVIAIIAHLLVFVWRPWLPPQQPLGAIELLQAMM